MKAVLLKAPSNLVVEEISEPSCPPYGIVVEVKACGICSSDVKMAKFGHRALKYPRILGHEISGIVHESTVDVLKVGDRVQIWPALKCGRCITCKRGADNHCKNIKILGFTYDGGMAKFLSIPIFGDLFGSVNLIPEDVSFEEATLAEPIACCLNAFDMCKMGPCDSILILGGGVIGAIFTNLSRWKGVSKVFLVEPLERRRKFIESFGIGFVFRSYRQAFEKILYETSGFGVDVIIFATSELYLDEEFFKILSPRGRVCIFSGMPDRFSKRILDLNQIHYKEFQVVGSYGCTSENTKKALDLIADKEIEVKSLITEKFSIDEAEKAFNYVSKRIGMKACITEF